MATWAAGSGVDFFPHRQDMVQGIWRRPRWFVLQTDEALVQIATFAKQWEIFKIEMDKLGDKLDNAAKHYQQLRTTRTNVLERPLRKLAELRDAGEVDPE